MCVLRVEGEDALVVAAHQQDGRKVLGQHLQPGHVQSAGHGALPGQRQTPAHRERNTVIMLPSVGILGYHNMSKTNYKGPKIH